MTFTIRTRGAGGFICAEYRCPDHGIFEATVQRDENGDAPDAQPCPEMVHSLIFPDDEYVMGTRCSKPSPWTVSAPHPRNATVIPYATVRGGDTERRPNMLDTRKLGSGEQTYTEWKKEQRNAQITRRHKQLIDNGVTSKKIQVG